MGKSFTREDGLMFDSSVIAMDSSGHGLNNAFLHFSNITLDDSTPAAESGYYTTTVNNSKINSNMRVINAALTTPTSGISSAVQWETGEGYIIFTYEIGTEVTLDLNFDLAFCPEQYQEAEVQPGS